MRLISLKSNNPRSGTDAEHCRPLSGPLGSAENTSCTSQRVPSNGNLYFFQPLAELFRLPFTLRGEAAGALVSWCILLSQSLFLGEERAWQQGHMMTLLRRARWHVGHSKGHFLL